jgi:hypothetical protein
MSETTRTDVLPTTPVEVAAAVNQHSWTGTLTIENAAAVADRVDRTLVGQHYAFAIQHEHENGAYRPELSTSCELEGPANRSLRTDEDSLRRVHLTYADGDRVWALHTRCTDAAEADAVIARCMRVTAGHGTRKEYEATLAAHRLLTEIGFVGDKITIIQYNGEGERLIWTVMVEDHTGSPR